MTRSTGQYILFLGESETPYIPITDTLNFFEICNNRYNKNQTSLEISIKYFVLNIINYCRLGRDTVKLWVFASHAFACWKLLQFGNVLRCFTRVQSVLIGNYFYLYTCWQLRWSLWKEFFAKLEFIKKLI